MDLISQKLCLREAYTLASRSPDTSTQNGAILYDEKGNFLAAGCNKFTKGMAVNHLILERPIKYTYIEHAERQAIYNFVRKSEKPGSAIHTMVATWASCCDCARAIVQCGVKVLIRHVHDDKNGRWVDSIKAGDAIMKAGGIEIINFEGIIGDCDPVLFDGKIIYP